MSRGARIAGAIALWLGVLIVGLYFTSSSDDNDPEGGNPEVAAASPIGEVTVVTTPPVEETTTSTTAETTTTTVASTTTTAPTTTTEAPVPGVVVDAALAGGRFSVGGAVPDQATADQIIEAATIVYGPEFERDLTVDSTLEPPPWLAGVPRAVTLLPIIGEGTLHVDDAGAAVTGTSPNDQALAAMAGAVELTIGVVPDVSNVDITGLGFPSFNARRIGEGIVLTGELANDAVKANIVDTALAVYGPEAVDDQITIGQELDIPFWSYTMPGVLQLFAAFPDYEINIADGITSGSLNDGANFATNSAELNDATIAILPIALGIMSRDPSLGIEIAGHTDNLGDPSYNQSLSEARAQAAADWLIDQGIAAQRIVVIGYGETQPIADNSTKAGRASNRRVEFTFGPLAAIVGG